MSSYDHRALDALLDSAGDGGSRAPSSRGSVGPGDAGTASFSLVSAGGVEALDGRRGDVSHDAHSAPVVGVGVGVGVGLGVGLSGGGAGGSGGGAGGRGVGGRGVGGMGGDGGSWPGMATDGLTGGGLEIGGLIPPNSGTSMSRDIDAAAVFGEGGGGRDEVDNIGQVGGMGGRAGTSTDGGSLAGLELSFGGAYHGMDGEGRGGLNVTFAAASRASSEGDGGYQSPDRSTTALLMDLIKQEESEDGEQAGDAVGIKRVDLNAVCGAPVGDTGVKQCRLHWEECTFRSHDSEERKRRVDDSAKQEAYVIEAKVNRGRAYLSDPILLVDAVNTVAGFEALVDLRFTPTKWAEIFYLVEQIASAGTVEDVEYRTDMLLRSAKKSHPMTPLVQRTVEHEREDSVEGRLADVEESVEDLDGRLQGVHARMGNLCIGGTQYATITSAIASVAARSATQAKQTAEAAVSPMATELNRLRGNLVSSLADLKRSKTIYDTSAASMPTGHTFSQIKTESNANFATLQKVVPMLVDLKEKVAKLGGDTAGRMVQGKVASQQPAVPSKVEADLKRLEATVTALTNKGKASASVASVAMANELFTSRADCRSFLEKKGPAGVSVMDLMPSPSYLMCRASDGVASVEHSSKQLSDAAKSGHDRTEQQLIATMSMDLPMFFTGGKDQDAAKSGTRLGRIATIGQWKGDDGISGVNNEMTKKVGSEMATLASEIQTRVGPYPELSLVLNSALSESLALFTAFCLELLSFHTFLILSTQRAGVVRSATAERANEQECWELVLRMVETVLDNIAMPLREVQNAYALKDPLDVSAAYMWASLQSIQIWRNFRDACWRSHPLVSPQVTLYLFQNRASKTEVEEIIEEKKSLQKKVDDLAKRLNQLDTSVGNLTKELKTIKAGKK